MDLSTDATTVDAAACCPPPDDCYDNETQAIMANLTGHVAGFTYHAYPGASEGGA
jgi:hypothetical protein